MSSAQIRAGTQAFLPEGAQPADFDEFRRGEIVLNVAVGTANAARRQVTPPGV